LGHTRVTIVITKRSNIEKWSKSYKNYFSSNFGLQLNQMKMELLVIENQNVSVNLFLSFAHTARQVFEISFILRKIKNLKLLFLFKQKKKFNEFFLQSEIGNED